MRRSFPTAVLMAMAAVIAACGGGGGGGGGGGANSNPPGGGQTLVPPPAPTINYVGNDALYAFTDDDVADIALTAVTLAAFYAVAELAWLDLGITGSIAETVNGDTGTATIEGELAADQSGFLIVDYDQFTVANITLHGRYVQHNRPDDGVVADEFDTPINGSAEFSDLSFVLDGTELVLRGVVTSAADGSAVLTANLLVTEPVSGEVAWLEDLVLERSQDTLPVDALQADMRDAVGIRINGRIYDNVAGRLDIVQTLPFRYTDSAVFPAEGGRMSLSGDNIRVTVHPLNSLFVGLVVDNAAADFRARRFAWTELGAGNTSVAPPTPPVANAGLDIHARLGEPVFPHSLFSSDPDGDFLRTQWQMVLRPVGSNAVLADAGTPEARFEPDRAGDYLLRATVTDGNDVRAATSRITVAADNESSVQATTFRGAIEGPRQFGVGASATLSARSWFRSVEEQAAQNTWSLTFNQQTSALLSIVTSSAEELVVTADAPLASSVRYDPASQASNPLVRLSVDAGPNRDASAFLFSELGPAEHIHFADFNNDGRDDLMAVVPFDPEDRDVFAPEIDGLAIFFANATGGFQPGILRRGGTGRINSGDINSDGLVDLVVTGLDGIFVLRQQASGEVGEPELLVYPRLSCAGLTRPFSGTEQLPVITDVFADGRPGIATLDGCSGREMFVWRQNPDGTLAAGERLATPTINQDVGFLTDIDSDGRVDALFGLNGFNNAAPALVVFRQTLTGELTEVANLGGACEQFDTPHGVTIDLNGDQRLDIVVVNGCEIAVHYQAPDGSFVAGPVTTDDELPDPVRDVYLDDYDADGDLDLLITDFSNNVWFAFQEDGDTFRIAFDVESEIRSQGLWPIDIDGDGIVDWATPINAQQLATATGNTYTIARVFLQSAGD